MHKSRKMFIKSVVHCCVGRLLKEAEENYITNPERTKRYLSLVMKFMQRYKIKLPREKRLKFCKKCLTYWVKGKTVDIKSNTKPRVKEYVCTQCGYKKRIRT